MSAQLVFFSRFLRVMKISKSCVVGGALVLLGLCSDSAVWAQTGGPAAATGGQMAPAGTTEKRTYQLRLRNIKPSLMAFWLDPQGHQVPVEVGAPPRLKGPADALSKSGVFRLPAGVDSIVAVDPQDALLVFGTAEGVAQLRETVEFLDRPLRQVEIEAQFVSIKAEDVAAFGIDFATARGDFNTNAAGMQPGTASKPGVQLGLVRGNFQATLTALQAAGRVKVISAPRVTAINNLTAQISQTTSVPVFLGTKDERGQFVPLFGGTDPNQNGTPLRVNTGYQLSATPTINNDDTVTVRLNVGRKLQLETEAGAPVELQAPVDAEVIANVRDGETIALGGFDPAFSPKGQRIPILGDIPLMSSPGKVPALGQIPTIGNLFRSKTAAPDQLIVFVTARIVRRGSEQPKPN